MDIPEQTSPPVAAPAVEDIQRDLVALRKDVSRLTQQVTDYVSKTGSQAVRDVNEQLEDAVRERPFLAVATAAGLTPRHPHGCGEQWHERSSGAGNVGSSSPSGYKEEATDPSHSPLPGFGDNKSANLFIMGAEGCPLPRRISPYRTSLAGALTPIKQSGFVK